MTACLDEENHCQSNAWDEDPTSDDILRSDMLFSLPTVRHSQADNSS